MASSGTNANASESGIAPNDTTISLAASSSDPAIHTASEATQPRASIAAEEPTQFVEGSPSGEVQQSGDRGSPVTPTSGSPDAVPQAAARHRWRDFKNKLYVLVGLRGLQRHVRQRLLLLIWNLAFGVVQVRYYDPDYMLHARDLL